MGMSTYVVGLRDRNDASYQAMVEVVRACARADVPLPEGVDAYFGPFAVGACAQWILNHHIVGALKVEIPTREWAEDMQDGIEVDIADIPAGVVTIRFVNSY